MFTTYAVRMQDGQKFRFVVGNYESEDEARHMADCTAIGEIAYAYVKGPALCTVFYLTTPLAAYFFHGPIENIRSLSKEALYPSAVEPAE
jgi:hypothetical protein